MIEASLPVRARMERLLQHMGHQLFEKERVLALSLLSALAGESIFLLGPPGVAKSMIARRLKLAFRDARAFEYLMGKFSTPDEVFGPVSISRLKNEDKYERLTDRYLPGAQVVFLDEIWKASPPIQNALLTVLNEKIYRNGEQEIKVDIRGLIAASNELPPRGEGLEALWDRFLIRFVVEGIQDESNFEALLTLTKKGQDDPVPADLKITNEEYLAWQSSIDEVQMPGHILGLFHELRRAIATRNKTTDPEKRWYISDRRWRKVATLFRTSAFLHQRQEIAPVDVLLAIDCLWDRPQDSPEVRDLILGTLVAHAYDRLLRLDSLRTQLELWQEEIAEETKIVKIEVIDRPKQFQDGDKKTYYRVLGYRGEDPVFMFREDWEEMAQGQDRILPLFDQKNQDFRAMQRLGAKKTEDNKLRISGKDYEILMEKVEEKKIIPKQPSPELKQLWDQRATVLLRGCDERLQRLEEQIQREAPSLQRHLFLEEGLTAQVLQAQVRARRMVLDLRLDIQKTQHSYAEMDKG